MTHSAPCDDHPTSARKLSRWRSVAATALLVPFLFLPYRWIWLPSALAASVLIAPSARGRRDVVSRNATLIVGAPAVLILRTTLDPGWWVPWMAVLGVLFWSRGQRWWNGKLSGVAIPLTWLLAAVLLARPDLGSLRRRTASAIDPNAVLVCAGDSLTSGVDKSDAETYVARLRSRLPGTVINAGLAGNRTADLLYRLQRDVLSRRPTAVLVFIGGNDYLEGTPRRPVAEALEAVVSRIAATGARVVLVEVPTGIIWNPYAGMYRRIAGRYGAILVPESRLRWWFSIELLARDHLANPLTIDGIHLSPSGATRVADLLQPFVTQALSPG